MDDGLNLKFEHRDGFHVCGYSVETCLDTCREDLSLLRRDFDAQKGVLFEALGFRDAVYGLMWYTQDHRYRYLIGVEAADAGKAPSGAQCVCIPAAEYAVATVPPSVSAFDAWTAFFEKALPAVGYTPDSNHGLYFEYYPCGMGSGADVSAANMDHACELWTPVIRQV